MNNPDNIIIDDDSQHSLISQVLDKTCELQEKYTPDIVLFYMDGEVGEATNTHLGIYKSSWCPDGEEQITYIIRYTQTIDSGVTILLKEMTYATFEEANNMYQRLKEKVI